MRKYYSVCDWLGNELFASNDEWEAVDWYDEHENGDGNADLQLFVYDEEPIVLKKLTMLLLMVTN